MSKFRIMLSAGIAAMLAVAVSCEKEHLAERNGSGEDREAEKTGQAVISLGGAADHTKAISIYAPNESRIERWAYWVFNSGDRAVKCGTGDGMTATVNLLTGDYTIVVIANYPTSGIWMVPVMAGGTKADLLNRVSHLSNNTYNCFVMKGEKDVTIEADQTSDIELKIARLVSKVGVKKISVSYDKASLAAKTTTLKGIYLTNIYKTSKLGSDYTDAQLVPTRSNWYNSMGWHRWSEESVSSEIDALVGDRNINQAISASSPHNVEHYFYTYPNPSKKEYDTHDTSAWSIRSSRLIIETEVAGKSYYYQITIPAMKRNTPYVASEVIIKTLGSTDPEEYIPGSLDIVFSTDNVDWEGDYDINEES